jgi:hypothetical protein
MKSKLLLRKVALISLIVVGFCFGAAQSALAYTTVYLEMVDPYSYVDTDTNGIAAIQFDILGPVSADSSNFTPNLPDGWFDFSSGTLVSAFDGGGTASLPNGVLGTFDMDVELGGWELTLQDGNVLAMGDNFPIEYTVLFDGTDYTITNAVPIPSALLLLGTGIAGLVGIRRKIGA